MSIYSLETGFFGMESFQSDMFVLSNIMQS